VMVPLIGLMFFMGLYPRPLLDRMAPSVDALGGRIHMAQAEMRYRALMASESGKGASASATLSLATALSPK
jgi:hypothetical protein